MDKRSEHEGHTQSPPFPFEAWYKQAANRSVLSMNRWPSRKWDGSRSAFLNLKKNLESFSNKAKEGAASSKAVKPGKDIAVPSLDAIKNGDHSHDVMESLVSDLRTYVDHKKAKQEPLDAAIALIEYVQNLVDDASVVIEKQESRIKTLERVNIMDTETNMHNQRGFMQVFEKELDRCRRGNSEGGLLIRIEIDNLDAINEQHGAKGMSLALKKVATTIQNQIRIMDLGARINHDEFVVLMPNTNKFKASNRAQDLAWQLGHLTIEMNGKDIPIWASLGLETYDQNTDSTDMFPENKPHVNLKNNVEEEDMTLIE